MAAIAAPPDPCPDDKSDMIARWDLEPRNLLLGHKVAWSIIATIAEQGYSTLADLGDLFDDVASAKANAGGEFGFTENTNGFTAQTSKLHSIRLAHAVMDAKSICKTRVERIHTQQSTSADLITAGHREALEKAYAGKNNGVTPSVKHQGSDHYLALQYKECQKGQVGWFSDKQIVGKLPDIQGSNTKKVETRKLDGTYEVSDAEVREPPQTWNTWKEQMHVFRTSLLMCVAACSQHRNLDIDKTDLDSFYDWLEGPEFGSHPTHRVPLTRLRSAEREAWRRICVKVHERTPLREALQQVRSDYLFWTPILMSTQEAGLSATGETKGKGKKRSASRMSQGKDWSKGKGKKKGFPDQTQRPTQRPKGKGKGKLASKDASGKEYCWAWNRGSCNGGCNRLHRCAKILSSGWTCNARHPALGCTAT